MISVICVQVENYLGLGQQYLSRMGTMLDRNLTGRPHRRICITDDASVTGWQIVKADPTLRGWWQKILCFKPGLLSGRCVFLDLDTIICGPLDILAEHKGILHLADWGWKKNDYGSGVMCWDAGEHEEIYSRYTACVPHCFRGDQDWATHLGGWPALPKGLNVSYRYHAKAGPPAGAVTVSMHGSPKPHEILTGWVPHAWG